MAVYAMESSEYSLAEGLLRERSKIRAGLDSELITSGYVLYCRFLSLIGNIKELLRFSEDAVGLKQIINPEVKAQLYGYSAYAHYFSKDSSLFQRRLQQAEFAASQVHNNFDRVSVLTLLSEIAMITQEYESASRTIRSAQKIAERHAMFQPVFMLLLYRAALDRIENAGQNLSFYLESASFSLREDVFIHRRYLILYWYYRFLQDGTEETREKALEYYELEYEALAKLGSVEHFEGLKLFSELKDEKT
jgi:hypothetical protein